MYKQNKESEWDPGDYGDPEEGFDTTQGLWTSSLWAPSCSFPLPQPVTSAPHGQKRGKGNYVIRATLCSRHKRKGKRVPAAVQNV